MTIIAPYGTWDSPVTAELTASSSKGLSSVHAEGDVLYWLETRPLEGGRSVLVRRAGDGKAEDLTPPDYNVRTRVHEYGGRSYVVADGAVYFSNFADQALYRQAPGKAPERMTEAEGLRFADCTFDATRSRLICVREDHRGDGEAINGLAAVPAAGGSDGEPLWQGSDFVGYPRVSTDGTQLAWIAWDHPNMPWDHVALWVGELDADGALTNARRLNPGVAESVLQPTWASDGTLYFVADRSGWWNLHRWDGETITAVHETAADFGGPLWGLGASYFALLSETEALVTYQRRDREQLARLSLETGAVTDIDTPFVGIAGLTAADGIARFLAIRSNAPSLIAALDLATESTEVLVEAGTAVVAPGYIAPAQAIEFPTANDETAHAFYYPPTSEQFQAPADERPPLMVLMHGGPTGATGPGFSTARAFWTSRGFAVVDVNYRGSTGYGRAYRERLNGEWGVVDLEDAVAATEYLVAEGLADPSRLLIRGGSAGGYTTLSALAFTDVFAAGANYFGVSDLEALAKHTHKFESRYLDSMIGPYPEALAVYQARSPINALDGFTSPLITFQGLEDRVVPPAQSEKIYQALRKRGTPTAYIPFEGEQHGFRKAENQIKALESELYFYGRVLDFVPAGDLPAVVIDNLQG
ncbi:MAG: prolyl oligopeptidase family serine peptidase [Pseudomonadota bacterium]